MKAYQTFLTLSIFFFTVLHGKPTKLIIDVDAGASDAIPIFLALASEEMDHDGLEVIAITCVYGNTELENVKRHVLKTLTVAKRNIPVFAGASRPLLLNFSTDYFFGSDGFGDFKFNESITAKIDDKHAVLAMSELVARYPGEVNILALGPLTNIAMAMRLDTNFSRNVKQIHLMGASVAGVGNTSPNVEFNFAADPEANFIVLNSTLTPVVIFPWETALKHRIPMDWRENVLGKLNSSVTEFINIAEGPSLKRSGTMWLPTDSMAAAVMLWPDLITESQLTNVFPVTDGAARGSILVDYDNKTGRRKNANIVSSINVERFKEILLKYLA